jgi:hypothetical protein
MQLFSLEIYTHQHLVSIYDHYFKAGLHHTTLVFYFKQIMYCF